MTKSITNEKLLARAKHGGRNVTGLAILASLSACLMLSVQFIGQIWDFQFVTWGVAILSVAYWFLAIAARRGNPLSLSIILGFFTVQFIFSLAVFVFAFIRTNGQSTPNILGMVIGLLIIVALSRNRTDLLELSKRGLWDTVFQKTSNPNRFSIIGGILMFAGFVSLYGGLAGSVVHVSTIAKIRQDFRNMILNDEKIFLEAFANSSGAAQDAEAFKGLLDKADKLQEKAQSIAQRASAENELRSITSIYVDAVGKWRSGLIAIRDEGVMSEQTRALFDEGDKLRVNALNEFDKGVPISGKRF